MGKMMTVTHGLSRDTRGCRCNICVTAEHQYQRDRYRRRHGLPVDTPDPPTLNVGVGDSQPGFQLIGDRRIALTRTEGGAGVVPVLQATAHHAVTDHVIVKIPAAGSPPGQRSRRSSSSASATSIDGSGPPRSGVARENVPAASSSVFVKN